MKKILALILAVALALSLMACGGGGAGDDSTTLKEEDAIDATPTEVYNDVKDNEARALQNVYKVSGVVDEIKSDYCRIDNLLVYLSSDDLATLSKGDTLVFLGQISSTENETRPLGLGTSTITYILFSNATLLETIPQQAGNSEE